MPQISKIRIVNFCYDDRRVLDELYDLASPDTGDAMNTLFNLRNGGGKSVFIMLAMQPIIPKARASEHRIEHYFKHPSDHSYILLEWNLDGSKEKLLTGISIAASLNSSANDDRRGNLIKYYTFTTQYDKHSEYSIENLELSSNENGKYFAAKFDYVRELAKSSKGTLLCYSSDDSIKWADYLSEYGIYKLEWETVMEELNKNEGALSEYFKDLKTSDSLISKFFIPAIDRKLMNVVSKGTDCSLETMLINYARKIADKASVIKQRDVNKELLVDLKNANDISDELYNANDKYISSVSKVKGFAFALNKKTGAVDEEKNNIENRMKDCDELIFHIEHEKMSNTYHIAKADCDEAKTRKENAFEILDKCKKDLEGKKHEESIYQCAELYRRIQKSKGKISELKKLIEDRESNSEDSERIANLKYSAFVKANEEKTEKENSKSALKTSIDKINESVSKLKDAQKEAKLRFYDAKEQYVSASSQLEEAKNNTDKRIKNLQIEITRRMDGFYAEDELASERLKRADKLEEHKAIFEQLEEKISGINGRKGLIPQEIAELKIKNNDVTHSLNVAENELKKYDSLYEKIKKICEGYNYEDNFIFSKALHDVLRRDIDSINSDIILAKRKLDNLNEKKKAAEAGYLHVLPEIMEYVNSTGLNITTGEEYICGLIEAGVISKEKMQEILASYPETAYALLFDNEKDIQKLLSAGNNEWLPAIVPLFTMEQMEQILSGNKDRMTFLTAYDKNFFEDRTGFFDFLCKSISETENCLSQYQAHLQEVKDNCEIVESFNYDENWRNEQEEKINNYNDIIAENNAKKLSFEKELEELEESLRESNKKQKEISSLIHENERWLDLFKELNEMVLDEKEKFKNCQAKYVEKTKAETYYNSTCDSLQKSIDELEELKARTNNVERLLNKINSVLEKVDNANPGVLLEGDYMTLYEQYNICLRNMDESLEGLRNSLDSEQRETEQCEQELQGYSCNEEEYTDPSLLTETLSQIRQQKTILENERNCKEEDYIAKNSKFSASEQKLKTAEDALSVYDGVILPKESISGNFKERALKVKDEKRHLAKQYDELKKEANVLEQVTDYVSDTLGGFSVEVVAEDVSLTENPKEQWRQIKTDLYTNKESYAKRKGELNKNLQEIIEKYKNNVINEIINKLYSIREMINNAEIKGDRLFTTSESINAMIESINKLNSKIETDLKEIDNDFSDLVNQCLLQGKRIYEDLKMISNSSKVRIYEDEPQIQMMKIFLPDEKELAEEASRASIRNEIEKGANEIKEMINNNADAKQIRDRVKNIVKSEKLLYKYIIKETIPIKVFKIEDFREKSKYVSWEEASTWNSGAEAFVRNFINIVTLMNYTKSASGVISKDIKSVLIMDNPFGKISSGHLVEPLFKCAKRFNVQLISFSDIDKSDVIYAHDCVIKLTVKRQALSNLEILTHEGNERIEHGYYKVTKKQMSLFD